jgi:hypothetical protein
LKDYLEINTMSLGGEFYEKEIEFKNWVGIWEKEQAKNEEMENLLGDDVDLDAEIRKLEQEIKNH